jgi:recombination protein RecA
MSTNKWLSKITKDFGVLASQVHQKDAPIVPFWSPSLNWATTVGGIKPGKVYLLAGAESSGKSMLALMGIIEMQRRDPEALTIWFDSEFSFSPDFFKKLGGDSDRLIVRKSNDPLKIFDYIGGEMLELLQDGAPIKAIVIDSIKSIRYPKDLKKQTTDMIMGGDGAAYLGSALKLVIPVIYEYQLITFLVQQARQNIDPQKALRNPIVIPDGNALKHAADVLFEITKLDTKNGVMESGETITGAAAQVGHYVRVKVKKNRLGKPARQAQFKFHYDHGIIDTGEEIFELAKSIGVIYHPTNPDTGKENVQMWQFEGIAVRGEKNMKDKVVGDLALQQRIMDACHKYEDKAVTVGDDGVVIEEQTFDADLGL